MTESTTEPSSGADAEEARKRAVENLTYLRALYSDVLRWYGVADSKAQVILTLNGVIIAFSSSSLLSGKEATWAGWARVFPWAAALCLASALYFAIDALHSNLHEANLRGTMSGIAAHGPYLANLDNGWWFGHLATASRTPGEARTASLRDSLIMYLPVTLKVLSPAPPGSHVNAVGAMLAGIGADEERQVLSAEIVALSVHVLEKHRSVNRGWVACGLGLFLVLLAAATAGP
jgi:hypothetical protein